MLTRITKFVVAISFSLLLNAQLAFAQTTTGTIQVPNPSRYGSLEEIINVLGGLIRPVVILVLIAMLMYGGWVRLTARDDAKKVESSSKIITAAIVGFAIIVLAPVIVRFVGSLLGVQGGILDFGS
jgi:hypothetical protein